MSHADHPTPRIAPARYRRRRRARRAPALALAALVVVAAGVAARLDAAGASAGTVTTSGEAARSTPRSEWRRGTVPELYQTDPAWADEPYAGSTIRVSGCGPPLLPAKDT